MAASFHNSSINGAYSRVAAGKMASSLPDTIVFSNQSENAFNLGPMEYTVFSSSFGLVPVENHNCSGQSFSTIQKEIRTELCTITTPQTNTRACCLRDVSVLKMKVWGILKKGNHLYMIQQVVAFSPTLTLLPQKYVLYIEV